MAGTAASSRRTWAAAADDRRRRGAADDRRGRGAESLRLSTRAVTAQPAQSASEYAAAMPVTVQRAGSRCAAARDSPALRATITRLRKNGVRVSESA
ncbi:hypothetical protein Smic_36630 [Streptomyces microflavus]|uniref:Uncharacterized protein n=1 Tax=Streptomyces microflavus TaxID=1919 RepID=A0A7J0CTL6_STRMI|nr:hypothetical protein Smic_36630 [Streptomyces microflavus]